MKEVFNSFIPMNGELLASKLGAYADEEGEQSRCF
jgi:hypothetical protein